MESDAFKRFSSSANTMYNDVLQLLNTDAISRKLFEIIENSNSETILYWLIQGANSNWVHPEKSSSALNQAMSKGLVLPTAILLSNGATVDNSSTTTNKELISMLENRVDFEKRKVERAGVALKSLDRNSQLLSSTHKLTIMETKRNL